MLQGETEGIRVANCAVRPRAGKPGVLVKKEMPPYELVGNRVVDAGGGALVDERERRQT